MLIAYLERNPGPIAADSPKLPSSVAAEAILLVPLVAQGRLVGLLSLGTPRQAEAYSADDLAFLSTLADESAAAARIAQLRSGHDGCQRRTPESPGV